MYAAEQQQQQQQQITHRMTLNRADDNINSILLSSACPVRFTTTLHTCTHICTFTYVFTYMHIHLVHTHVNYK